jgi:hypothetical protein
MAEVVESAAATVVHFRSERLSRESYRDARYEHDQRLGGVFIETVFKHPGWTG